MPLLRVIPLVLGVVPTTLVGAYKPWFNRPTRFARGSQSHHSVEVDFGTNVLPEPSDIDVRPLAPGNKSVRFEELGRSPQEMRDTIAKLRERKRILSAAVADKLAAVEEERRRQAYRGMQAERLAQQLPEGDAAEEEVRRKIEKVRGELAAERDRPLHSPGWATMKAVGAAGAGAGSDKKKLGELDAKIRRAQKENEKLQADIDESTLKNSKLRDDVSMMKRRGYAQALDTQEIAANLTAEHESLANFTETFVSRQDALSATLEKIVSPWVEQWESMSKGRDTSSLELSGLEPEMHMKAYKVMENFDGKMKGFANEQTCFYEPLLTDERVDTDQLQSMYQPSNFESVTPEDPMDGTVSFEKVHPHNE